MNQPIKWHGGKHYLAKKIIELMPKHLHYVETHFGGGSVLLNKSPEDVSEVVNDISSELTNFWRVLQDEKLFEKFKRRVEAIPFSEVEYEWGMNNEAVEFGLEMAIAFFVRCRQSRAGQMKSFATLSKNRTRKGMNEQVSAWLSAIEGLPEIHNRLKRVVIYSKDAIEVIKQEDSINTLYYCDPPYLHSTRASKDVYENEMSDKQHEELLSVAKKCVGAVIISGYNSELYNDMLTDWEKHEFDLPNNVSGGDVKRRMTEVLWIKYANK